MHLSDLLPIVAMAGVGALFVLIRVYTHNRRLTSTARIALGALIGGVFVACCAAAAGSALQIARIGLAGTPPPSMFGAVGRLIGVAFAIALWPSSQRHIERAAILTFVVGAGASALIGLGLRSGALDAARVVYHLLMYMFGAILAMMTARLSSPRVPR